MTDEPKKLDPYEAMRLELDRARLEVERARLKLDAAAHQDQRTRTYLERWRTDVGPLHESEESAWGRAYGYAQTAIRSLYLLNGGALVAFPAFAQLAGTPISEHLTLFLLSGGSFVSGLVLVGATNILAYVSADAQVAAVREEKENVKINLNRSHNEDGYTEREEARTKQAATLQSKYRRTAYRTALWCLGLGAGSLVMFLAGAIFAALVLSGTAFASMEAVGAAPVVAQVSPEQGTAWSGVVAGATAVMAVASVASFVVAFFLVKENQLLRKAGTEPEVVAYLLPDRRHPTTLNFVLANIGRGPARDVEYWFEADAEDFAAHNVHVGNTAKRKAVSVLPQGERIVMLFGTGWEAFKEPRLKPFKVEVRFYDLKGKERSAKFDLDVAQFDGMVTLGTPAEHEIAEALKKIAKTVKTWSSSTSGKSRLAVETITTDEGRKQAEEWLAAQKARGTAKDPGAG